MDSRKIQGPKVELPRHRNFRTTRNSCTEHVVSYGCEPLRHSQGRVIIPGATVLIPSTVGYDKTLFTIETLSVCTWISALHFWRRCHRHCVLMSDHNEIKLRSLLSLVFWDRGEVKQQFSRTNCACTTLRESVSLCVFIPADPGRYTIL
jgi:hypothetical protein